MSKQNTFGNVKYSKLNEFNPPFCDRSKLDGNDCENRAVYVKDSSLENKSEYICKTHMKKHELEEVEKDG
jgi:hypothetical protein